MQASVSWQDNIATPSSRSQRLEQGDNDIFIAPPLAQWWGPAIMRTPGLLPLVHPWRKDVGLGCLGETSGGKGNGQRGVAGRVLMFPGCLPMLAVSWGKTGQQHLIGWDSDTHLLNWFAGCDLAGSFQPGLAGPGRPLVAALALTFASPGPSNSPAPHQSWPSQAPQQCLLLLISPGSKTLASTSICNQRTGLSWAHQVSHPRASSCQMFSAL